MAMNSAPLVVIVLSLLATIPSAVCKHDRKHRESEGKDRVVVKTSLGGVMGFRNGTVTAFLGVPFAEPPTGRYRFRPPRPKRPWYPSTYEALDFGPECLQSSLYSSASEEEAHRDEDCLYLNIWRPSNADSKNNVYPVLLWIYGGAFLHGAASRQEYFGDRLANRGVVVVSCNYRLGALGFLVSTSDGLFGNYGLHDQKLVMQWVQVSKRL
jgi:carboxylesterase type B